MTDSTEHDVIVVGAGPAGATLATVIAQAGHRVLLLERERGPRYQIGESLLPATVRQLADILGLRDRLQAAGFIVKRGATFSWGSDPDTLWTMNFGRVPPRQTNLPRDAPTAFNVPRHTFDRLLLENAVAKGVDVREGSTVTALLAEEDVVRGVRYTDPQGVVREARSRFVALTGGQRGLSSSLLGAREYSTFFRKVSVFGYFEGGGRLPAPLDGNVFFETYEDAWLWHIPLSETLTSVGAVVPAAHATRVRADPAAALAQYIGRCPKTAAMLRGVPRATTSPFHETRLRSEYSYCHTRFWSSGLVAVGDAACFVDVLLSSGVHLATYGALLAARSINGVLDGRIDELLAMDEYETRLRLEYAIFYRGLVGLYDMSRDAESYVTWLRTLLQDSNGVYLEWREQARPMQPTIDARPDMRERSQANLEAMRAYTASLVRYDGQAGMTFEDSLPTIQHTLAPSVDGRQWADTGPLEPDDPSPAASGVAQKG